VLKRWCVVSGVGIKHALVVGAQLPAFPEQFRLKSTYVTSEPQIIIVTRFAVRQSKLKRPPEVAQTICGLAGNSV
jgi:hypothetical protein